METVEGYPMGVGCTRKDTRDELRANARVHTRDCALMGHCVESGYGIVSDDTLTLLDPAATPHVVDAVAASETERGIRRRATREPRDGAMETTEGTETAN